jgi:MYXO-CTERM domain-containing protein
MATFRRARAHAQALAAFSVVLFGAASASAAPALTAGDPANNFDLTTWLVSSGAVSLAGVTDFRFVPDGRMVLTRKVGNVVVRKNDGTLVAAGVLPANTVSEQGLLGVEVHPDFANNQTLFFYYSSGAGDTPPGTDLDRQRVVSIVLKADNTLDMTTEKILVQGFLHGPANHDGGALSIGPDKKLYIGVGDTGCNSGVAPGGAITNYFGTCLTNGNGKILRVNLDGTIPNDNPLVGVAAASACSAGASCGADIATTGTAAPRTEIWAWGFRNPFRFWHDPKTGSLWVGDVGEVTYEEVTIVQKGKHHGWPYREGAHGYPVAKCQEVTPNAGDCVEPLYDCSHSASVAGQDGECQSITGGLIVDSCDWPATFRGQYFFADNSKGTVFTIQTNAARSALTAGTRKEFGNGFGTPTALHAGPDGALYIANFTGNNIARIAPKAPVTCPVVDAGVDGGPSPDGGSGGDAGGSDGGGTGPFDASFGNDGGEGGVNGATGDTSGCGCRVTGPASADPRWLVLALAGLAFVRRRTRGAAR